MYIWVIDMDMDFSKLLKIKVIPSSVTSSFYMQNRDGLFHLSYKDEKRLYTYIREGRAEELFQEPDLLNNIGVGKLADDDLTQFKYLAVSFITLAVRSAIEGGLDEKDAYGFSDMFIQRVDKLKDSRSIINEGVQAALALSNSVKEIKSRLRYSPHIRRAVAYIDDNLDKKITVGELAQHCGLSDDYLSHIFKKEMGISLVEYILNQKLDLASQLLTDGIYNSQMCYALGFSSQSHFISVFKKKYGVTPKAYANMNK